MIAIGIRFLSGRFHATPWGRHVNEGATEWPPSPWRFLRALVATWKTRLNEEIDRGVAEPILRSLAEPPEFYLPPASTGHTRHYMPWYKKGPHDRTLVFDSFVALPSESEIFILWPEVILDDSQRSVLSCWLTAMGFLGRSEGWCDARLLSDDLVADVLERINCRPLGSRTADGESEVVSVLCADPAKAFEDTHTPKMRTTTGRRKAKATHVRALYEPDWHLCGETLWLHGERWSDPPGSCWVRYSRPSDCFRIVPRWEGRPRAGRTVQVARFALDSTVLPLVSHTLTVAEDARRNLMGIFGRRYRDHEGRKGNSPVFSGKADDGTPGVAHGHAFYLPTDEDGDGRLDHVTIVAANGFGDRELAVLDAVREIKSREREHSGHPLRLLLLSLQTLETAQSGPIGPAATWVSATPFLAPRFPKARGTRRDPPEILNSPRAFLAAAVREELGHFLARRPDLKGIDVESIVIDFECDEAGNFRLGCSERFPGLRPIQYKRFRQKTGDNGGRRTCGAFRLTFPTVVRGPICLGHSSHFGLGLFIPVAQRSI